MYISLFLITVFRDACHRGQLNATVRFRSKLNYFSSGLAIPCYLSFRAQEGFSAQAKTVKIKANTVNLVVC